MGALMFLTSQLYLCCRCCCCYRCCLFFGRAVQINCFSTCSFSACRFPAPRELGQEPGVGAVRGQRRRQRRQALQISLSGRGRAGARPLLRVGADVAAVRHGTTCLQDLVIAAAATVARRRRRRRRARKNQEIPLFLLFSAGHTGAIHQERL